MGSTGATSSSTRATAASGRNPQQAWTKIAVLMTVSTRGSVSGGYIGFVASFADELTALENTIVSWP